MADEKTIRTELTAELEKTGVFEWKRSVVDSLPCDTYQCADRLWCIQRGTCKKKQADPRQFIGWHFIGLNPYMFRTGKPARIEGIITVRGRECFHLRWSDGVQDWSPVVDEDFSGIGGEGVFYTIAQELPDA